jgi:hypothetical protein
MIIRPAGSASAVPVCEDIGRRAINVPFEIFGKILRIALEDPQKAILDEILRFRRVACTPPEPGSESGSQGLKAPPDLVVALSRRKRSIHFRRKH